MTAGYVYALINPSMPNLVKVGRTTKDPQDRAKELSAVTGVATPFIVGYQRFTPDCVAMEQSAHVGLEARGYRVSSSREFFEAPLHAVVDVLSSLQDLEVIDFGNKDDGIEDVTRLGERLFNEGLECINGSESQFKNPERGLDLLNKAAKLNHHSALFYLGLFHLTGQEVPQNEGTAMSYFDAALSTKEPMAFYQVYRTLIRINRRSEALIAWRRFVSLLPACPADEQDKYSLVLGLFRDALAGDKFPAEEVNRPEVEQFANPTDGNPNRRLYDVESLIKSVSEKIETLEAAPGETFSQSSVGPLLVEITEVVVTAHSHYFGANASGASLMAVALEAHDEYTARLRRVVTALSALCSTPDAAQLKARIIDMLKTVLDTARIDKGDGKPFAAAIKTLDSLLERLEQAV